jgi:hypothetical protein
MSNFLAAIPVDLLDKVESTVTRVYPPAVPREGDWVVYQSPTGFASFYAQQVELIGNAYAAGHGSAYPAAVVSGFHRPVSHYTLATLDHYGGGFPAMAEGPRKIVLRG